VTTIKYYDTAGVQQTLAHDRVHRRLCRRAGAHLTPAVTCSGRRRRSASNGRRGERSSPDTVAAAAVPRKFKRMDADDDRRGMYANRERKSSASAGDAGTATWFVDRCLRAERVSRCEGRQSVDQRITLQTRGTTKDALGGQSDNDGRARHRSRASAR
jgi:hypothetical protein